MRRTINALITSGYRFAGLDESGEKVRQISSNNASKLLSVWPGLAPEPATAAEIERILDNGRTFLKEHLPDLVLETDDEWNGSPDA